jgi:hypothetical protein
MRCSWLSRGLGLERLSTDRQYLRPQAPGRSCRVGSTSRTDLYAGNEGRIGHDINVSVDEMSRALGDERTMQLEQISLRLYSEAALMPQTAESTSATRSSSLA